MKKKKSILFIIIPVIVAVVVIAAIVLSTFISKLEKSSLTIESLTLKTETLQNKISSTGDVESDDNKNVYSSLTYPVKEVNVEVGDSVNAGDVLCLIDSDTLTQQIAEKEASLEDSNVNSSYDLYKSEKTYNEAKNNLDNGFNTELNSAEAALKSAELELENAKTKYENAQKTQTANGNTQLVTASNNFDTAKTNLSGQKSKYEYLLSTDKKSNIESVQAAETKYEELLQAYKAAKNNISTVQAMGSASVDLATSTANDAKKDCEDQLNTIYTLIKTDSVLQARKTLAEYQEKYFSTKETYDNLVTTVGGDLASYSYAVDTAQLNYDKALSAYDATKLSVEQQLGTYKADLEKNQATSSNKASVLELANLKTKLDECTVTAPITGTVTAVYAKEGTAPNGVMFIIENTQKLIVKAKVKEYDIGSISENMKALIETDATGDEVYEGYVSKIAPTAIKNNTSVASSSATEFEIEVTVNSADTKLLIGMNARVSIITNEVDNAYAVRYDAIETDDDGNSFVYTAKDNGDGTYTAEKVAVTTGLETDFEIQISGEGITDGTIVITDIENIKAGSIVRLSE